MKIICIVGPTGVGKTKLSLEIAKKFNGQIINADSTQVYKGLDIATAKVIDKENIIHHLIDIKETNDNYTVYDFKVDAKKIIEDLDNKNITPIIVGGTGLYIKALLYDYSLEKEEKKDNKYESYSKEELYDMLMKIDPNSDIHINNTQRIKRALSYYDVNNKPLSAKEKNNKLVYDVIFIGLTTNKEKLYNIINNRVNEMIDAGLINEAKAIYESNIRTKAITTPIGYKELFPYFEGIKSKEDCIEEIKKRTRNYAKRQYTWFNNQMDINWFNVDFDNFNNTINEVLEYIKKA
jgi:tRNA dimethylallyltransferase